MSHFVERDSAALLLPLLRDLCDLSAANAVWKNADAGLDGTGDVDFAAPRSVWPAIEDVFRSWAAEGGMGPVVACGHMPDTLFLIAVDRSRSDFVQLDVRSRMTFRGSTVFLPDDLESCSELDARGFRRLRPGAEGLLKLVVSGIAPGGRPKDRALVKEGVVELLSRDPHGMVAGAALCGPVREAARSGAEALSEGGWNRRAMATVEAWFVVKGLTEPLTAWGRARAKRAKARCELIQTSIRSSRRIPGNLNEWLARVELDHTAFGAMRAQEEQP
jgi:hypothetical protein